MSKGTPPPKSKLSRSFKILSAGLSIARDELSSYVKTKISDSELAQDLLNRARVEQSKVIADTLSQLKGSAMKMGQMLSLEAQDLLPPEAIEILSKLQNQADPVRHEILFKLIEDELGVEKFNELKLEVKPIGVASIGQVFKGRLSGQDVAVKVQYPGIADSIGSDVEVLKKLITLLTFTFGKKIDFDEVFEEVKIVLNNEANYELEAKHLARYSQMLASQQQYRVPHVFKNYSSQSVLTMSYLSGITLKEWVAKRPDLASREKIGRSILDLYCKEFFEEGFVQTDPNLANFLIDPVNESLGLLDFGAVLTYTQEFRLTYKKLLRVIFSSNERSIIDFCVQHNYFDAREKDETKKLFINMLNLAIQPFRPEHQPFRFVDKNYSAQIRDAVFAFTKSAQFTAPPRELIFLHRKLGGIFNMLKLMELEMDLTPYYQKMVND